MLRFLEYIATAFKVNNALGMSKSVYSSTIRNNILPINVRLLRVKAQHLILMFRLKSLKIKINLNYL